MEAAANSSSEKGSLDENATKRRPRNIGELKEEAKNLKEAMVPLTNERREAKAKLAQQEELYELCKASGVEMNRAVFVQIMELLDANVHPDGIYEFLQALMQRKTADREIVTLI